MTGYLTSGNEGSQLPADAQNTLIELDAFLVVTRDAAARDGLSGMPNRREGERRLREDLAKGRTNQFSFAVLLVDADGLKEVNDRWGHTAGDAYLQHLSLVIIQAGRSRGWVARLAVMSS